MLARGLLESDADRGVALLDFQGNVLYRNAAAGALLRDGSERGRDPLLPRRVEHWLTGYVEAMKEAKKPLRLEAHYPSEEDRRLRVTMDVLPLDSGPHIALRVQSALPWSEPTVRRLQSRFGLTLREAQVASLVARGQTNAEAALRLGIVEKTVKNVLMIVFSKCGVRNRVELALRAFHAPVFQSPGGTEDAAE